MPDALDYQLLDLLQQDARLTTKELAARTGLSPTPVFERIKKLERQGYIVAYQAVLNRERLGPFVRVFCTVSLKEHHREHLEGFEASVRKLHAVAACYHIAGLFDYLLEVIVPDMPAYENFIRNELAAIPFVGKVQSSFVMTEITRSRAVQLPNVEKGE